jgi:Protein of unknown function (DUF1553)/Protein of unknown function (DUF1549)/Planctomycete cytochrome C
MTRTSLRQRYVPLALLGFGLSLLFWLAAPPTKSHSANRTRPTKAPPTGEYARDIKSILQAHCYTCHGPKQRKGGLRLDTVKSIHKGGDSGAVIVPGDASNSVLIALVSGAEDQPRMPPSGPPLSVAEITLLKKWIDGGALTPGDGEPELRLPSHWAFRPPSAAPLPAIHDASWINNPIDAFLAEGHESNGLTPSAAAARGLLLRRLYIDLIGLPPGREELQAFLADNSKTAYEQVVDRLLASPQHGERWARHWMDVWRYSDQDGRKSKMEIWWSNEHIWRWRDWIIQSLNSDMGYDRMIVAMLAGDEAEPQSPEALAATGFLVRNWFKLNRNIWLNNTIEHTGKAFLGLTINCARCHDHKFDPISQKEYYQFRAFLEPHDIRTEQLPIESDGQLGAVTHAYDAVPAALTWIFVRGDDKTPDKTVPILPGVPAALGGPEVCITPISKSDEQSSSTGRRLALACWTVDRKNPLAARVAVNHIWAWHFGRPLVQSTFDFGLRCPPPVHQKLLDWLAVDFMDHDWSMKRLHRLIVTSSAYRMTSSLQAANPANLQADPDNHYYWRMDPQRMEAEVLRDSLLKLAGNLDLTMRGPPVDCQEEPNSTRRSLYFRYSREDKLTFLTAFDAASVEECYRRHESVVPQQALALANSVFVWDQARLITRGIECDVASSFEPASQRAIVTAAFEHILGRAPSPEESVECEAFLARQEALLTKPARLSALPHNDAGQLGPAQTPQSQAEEYLIHALLNHNDFITIR